MTAWKLKSLPGDNMDMFLLGAGVVLAALVIFITGLLVGAWLGQNL